MDLFGQSPAQVVAIDVKGDKVFVNNVHRAFYVHDEACELFYVGEALETESVPYGCAETLDDAIEDWRSKVH
jgi:hypothetical protein